MRRVLNTIKRRSWIDRLILEQERATFNQRTRLSELRPDAAIEASLPGKYEKLLHHIDVHRYYLGQEPTQSFQIEEQYSAQMKGNTRGERIVVECYDTGKLGRISTGRLKKEFTKNNKVKEINLTYDRIIKETGATKSGLENLRSLVVFEVSPGDGSSKYRLFAFQHENILTMYARRMRPNSNGFDDQAPVIVSQLSFQLEPDLKGNVQVEYTE